MAVPLHTPRVNNNDDIVRLLRVMVQRGDSVDTGDVVAEVETDKASFTVEADRPGYVLAVVPQPNDTIAVGSVLIWVGDSPDDPVPDHPTESAAEGTANSVPTVKAIQLLERYGLRQAEVPASDERLSARDVEAYVGARGLQPIESTQRPADRPNRLPLAPGTSQTLTPAERGMLRTVLWQRQEAVPAYVELQYDVAAWNHFAADYQKREELLLSPLLALMSYRLSRIARDNPRLTSTIVGDRRWEYSAVNLGFTVQSDTTLYMVVVEDAASMTCAQFVERLTTLQRKALAHQLRTHETTGATIAFSSMARWNATLHIPVLPPQTALIVAHTAPAEGGSCTLGVTYDHRVLTGFEALEAISALSRPEGLL